MRFQNDLILVFTWLIILFFPCIVVQQFQAYTEPETNPDSAATRRTSAPASGAGTGDEEAVVLPLGETTLTHNLGVPIVVVVTKVRVTFAGIYFSQIWVTTWLFNQGKGMLKCTGSCDQGWMIVWYFTIMLFFVSPA